MSERSGEVVQAGGTQAHPSLKLDIQRRVARQLDTEHVHA
ncbi:hypothetical protein C4J95_0715 [Pseudomonas orientalis]|nr:hypothetical protein C4J95_0715 [Pseudomonas orientalis]